MSKAIAGAALLVGAAVAVTVLTGGLTMGGLLALTSMQMNVLGAMAMGGVAMEAGAIADALTSNRGSNITTRQPAAQRQVIRGIQRVGGVMIYESATGSTHRQYNQVIVVSGHVTWAILGLYLDGRKVYFDAGSGGHTVRNGVGFGGSADHGDHVGPGGEHYNFGDLVYCEARYGDQAVGDVISGLTANDPRWAASSAGSPYVGGCTYIYLKVKYDENVFPGAPEVKVTVMGKPVYDPRTGLTQYSANWALHMADILSAANELDDPRVNTAQLIAAANVCDEQVELAGGGTENRYECHTHYDTATGPSDILSEIIKGAAGRLSDIGGEYYIWPAYWQGPAFTFGPDAVTSPIQWSATRSFKDLFNRVTGTYIAANYPYNVAGNLFDSNGWYDGSLSNTFPFGFQPTNIPQYAKDVQHGYGADEYLLEDGGVVLPREISLHSVLSVTQAQRVLKINLMRNRKQGSGSWDMQLFAAGMQPCDVLHFTFPFLGWADKVLEVVGVEPFRLVQGSGEGDAPSLRFGFTFQETGPDVYAWSTAEELTVYDVPALGPGVGVYSPAPPTSMSLTSSAATAVIAPDGTVTPRIRVDWDTPLDAMARQIQTRFQKVGDTAWTDGPLVDIAHNYAFIAGVVAGDSYNVAIRSRRSSGGTSVWVEIDGFAAGYVLSSQTQDGFGIGSLTADAYAGAGASITCNPFTALVGNRSLAMFPSGAHVITGLAQRTLYYIYWDDPTGVGGDVTPVATTNRADWLSVPGRFLIDSIVTPYLPSGGTSGSLYRPSRYVDAGSRITRYPEASYDGDLATCAIVSGSGQTLSGSPVEAAGSYFMQGFPPYVLTASATLTVDAQVDMGVASTDSGDVEIVVMVGSSSTTLLSATTVASRALYTLTIPSGTALDSISIVVTADASSTTSHVNVANAYIFETFIQA